MFRRIALIIIFVIMLVPFGAYAEEWDFVGFDTPGGYTETKNEYYFDPVDTYLIVNNELFTNPDYQYEVYAGSDIYLPLYVYPDGGKDYAPVTDKMVKTDQVEVSAKVLRGAEFVGDVALIDAKKLKSSGLPAGIYAHIPLTGDYEKITDSVITMRLVLSVNGVSYQHTRINFKCYLQNRVQPIRDNSVYGAKTPTQFKVAPSYNGMATFDFGNNIRYTARVKGDAKYYMNLSREPVESIVNMYSDAYLDFYEFKGDRKTFSSIGQLEIPVKRESLSKKDAPASLYVYRIDNGTLKSLGSGSVSFDMKTSKLTINAKTLGHYVLSNRALMETVDNSEENILKSGYASAVSPETSEVSETSDSAASSPASQAPASSSSAPSSSADSQPSNTFVADDGYVPEEPWDNPNQNVSTGLPIYADNTSSDNPSTSDPSLMPFVCAGIPLSLLLFLYGKRKPESK